MLSGLGNSSQACPARGSGLNGAAWGCGRPGPTLVQVSDAVLEEATEVVLLGGVLAAEAARPDKGLPQEYGEGRGQRHRLLLIARCGDQTGHSESWLDG